MLKGDASLTLLAAAVRLGRSERTLQRWVEAYRRGGLAEVLNPKIRRGRPKRLQDDALKALKSEVQQARLPQLSDVRTWLKERFGLDFSIAGVWHIMQRDLGAVPRGWITVHDDSDRAPRGGVHPGDADVARRIVQFLNALPITGNVTLWISSFRDALATFLGDVDRITVSVDLNFDLANPESYDVGQKVFEHFPEQSARSRFAMAHAEEAAQSPSTRLLREAAKAGFPVSTFHDPSCFDYYIGQNGYLGSLLLWRNRDSPPISQETLTFVAEIESFVRFALSDIIARNRAERPIDSAFSDALKRLNEDANLTPQQQRIIVLQLLGHSHKEMSDVLSISVDAIKKQFTQIYRKTNTHTQPELFAKYFSFRINQQP